MCVIISCVARETAAVVSDTSTKGGVAVEEIIFSEVFHKAGVGTQRVVALWKHVVDGNVTLKNFIAGAELDAFKHFAVRID